MIHSLKTLSFSFLFLSLLNLIVVSKSNMSVSDRSLATSSGISMQGGGGSSTSGGPNQADDQTEPTSTLGIFALDYKK
jgi:hypothetical protein